MDIWYNENKLNKSKNILNSQMILFKKLLYY